MWGVVEDKWFDALARLISHRTLLLFLSGHPSFGSFAEKSNLCRQEKSKGSVFRSF
jgi:hypothetical protein